jgi:hypothetical protein
MVMGNHPMKRARIRNFATAFVLAGWAALSAAEPPAGGLCLDMGREADVRNGGKAFWEDPTSLKVRFLDGSEELQRRVIRHATDWKKCANVGFDFRGANQADIRISFARKGSWSFIGTGARGVEDPTQPTMNLEMSLETPEVEFRRTVLHEFGHALGLVHEHQINQGNPIRWNEAAVIQAHAYVWSEAMVRAQILDRYKSASIFNRTGPKYTTTKFDPRSIMLYPIRKDFTLDGYSVDWNNEISDGDKAFLATIYGKPKS